MNIRQDIQILRGIAVLLVVLFHLDIQGLQSGFLGVDVFFVISGFLMAILYKPTQTLTFFIKRAQRLLPAYFVVIVVTVIAGYALTTPNEFKQIVQQSKFASVFASNIGFWIQNSYFSKTEFNPLLHLWSLGVEIQFYILVPVLFYFFSRSTALLAVVISVSLISCLLLIGISSKTAFFLTPFRFWEFLIGYVVAKYFTNNGAVKFAGLSWIGVVGLIVVLLIPLIDVNGEAPNLVNGHPALSAIVISIATAAVLAFGISIQLEKSIFGSGLTKLGDYSYSIYLAHFPIIVLYLSKPFSGTVTDIETLFDFFIIFSLIVVLSLALYHLVERQTKRISIIPFVIIAPIATFLFPGMLAKHQYNSQSKSEQLIFDAFHDRTSYRCGKLIRILQPTSLTCSLNEKGNQLRPRILLVGNSHADSIKTTFADIAEQENTEVFFFTNNTPLMAGGITNTAVVDEAVSRNAEHIVLHYSPEAAQEIDFAKFSSLAAEKNIMVSLIDPVPVWPQSIPQAMYYNSVFGEKLPVQTKEDYLHQNSEYFKKYADHAHATITRYAISDIFCAENCVFFSEEGAPYYFDHGHLTLTGSKLLENTFRQILRAPF